MTNKVKGEFSLKDGKVIVLDFNALIIAEEKAGKSFPQIFQSIGTGNFTGSEMRALMFAGLRKYHPETTLEDAGNLVLKNMDTLIEAFAFVLTDPTAEETEDEGEGKQKAVKAKN